MQLYVPTHQDSSRFDGKVSHAPANTVKRRYVRQKLYHFKVQRANVALSARNYVSSKFDGQTSLCPPEAISAQSSIVKRRYVRQVSAQSFQSENKLLTRSTRGAV